MEKHNNNNNNKTIENWICRNESQIWDIALGKKNTHFGWGEAKDFQNGGERWELSTGFFFFPLAE